jgi:hypothetical protein
MLSVKDFINETWEWGPNQSSKGNGAHIKRLLTTDPNIAVDHKHGMHRVIPMSECRTNECLKTGWEHNPAKDPGELSWEWQHIDPAKRISPTATRRILEIEDVASDELHIFHKQVPNNLCEVNSCKVHYTPPPLYYDSEAIEEAKWWGKKTRKTNAPAPGLQPSMRQDTRDRISAYQIRFADTEVPRLKCPRRANKPMLDDVQARPHHRDLTNDQCELEACPWHTRAPTPSPCHLGFTPNDTESEDEAITAHKYVKDIKTSLDDLLFACDAFDEKRKLDMEVPLQRFNTFLKLRVDPQAEDPKERFSLHLKAFAKEPETESESEEDGDYSEDEELYHGYHSGNEGSSGH